MTENSSLGDDDRDAVAFMRRLFGAAKPVPDDIVDAGAWRGLTAEDMRRLNAAAGTWAEVTLPGEIICDNDGNPIGVGPPRTEAVFRGPAVVTRSQLYKVGLTPSDVPNLTMWDDPQPKTPPKETPTHE